MICRKCTTPPRIALAIILFGLLYATNVEAITLPGTYSILAEAAGIPFLFLVSILGGWYVAPVINRRLRAPLDVAFVTFCFMLSCAGVTLSVTFYCLVRGIFMIASGKGTGAILSKWLWGGIMLMLSCIVGYTALAFRGCEPLSVEEVNGCVDGLKVLVAYETAYWRTKGAVDKHACHFYESKINAGILNFSGSIIATSNGYIVRVIPTLPWCPFDRISSAPLFVADESGAIRMCYINRHNKSPSDMPVVAHVTEDEVQVMENKIAAGIDSYDIYK